jgi:hypothetical protein
MSERSVAKKCTFNVPRLLLSLGCYPKMTSGSRLSEICGILCLNFSEADS